MPGFRSGVGPGFIPEVYNSAQGRMVTVLGSLRDTSGFIGRPGFNVLNFSDAAYTRMGAAAFGRFNAEWFNAAMQRGDAIWLLTNPATHSQLMLQLGKASNYLDIELLMMENFDASTLPVFVPAATKP